MSVGAAEVEISEKHAMRSSLLEMRHRTKILRGLSLLVTAAQEMTIFGLRRPVRETPRVTWIPDVPVFINE